MSDGYDCLACKRRNDAEDMVECTKCKKWLHFSCAGVDASVEEKDWFCKECKDLSSSLESDRTGAQSSGGLSNVTMKKMSDSRIKDARSNVSGKDGKSIASSSRSRRSVQLELLRLEEQKKIDDKFLQEREKREREFIERKYELLAREAVAKEDLEDDNSLRLSQTRDWVEKSNIALGNPMQATGFPEEKNLQCNTTIAYKEPGLEPDFLDQRQIAARQVMAKDLPTFSGRPEEWPLFISSFENDTKLCGFSNQENLSRLQRALKGRALEAVGTRLMMPSNVPEVIETLRMLYGQPEYIIDNILKRIRMEPGPKEERLESLVTFALSVRSVHCMIEACSLTHYLSNRTLLRELVDKLPPTLKLNWAMTMNGDETLTTFTAWLYNIAQAACKVTPCAETRVEKRQSHLHAHSENKHNKSGCYLCDKDHKLVTCSQFADLSVKRRWDIVSNRNICEVCLSHPKVFKCRKQAACGVNGCQLKHHQLLHSLPRESKSPGPVVGCYEHQSSNANDILFSIIPVVLHSKGKSLETFAFLDNGSSLTLVEEDVANELELEGISKPLCLKWTADTVRFEKESRIVPLEISSSNLGSEKHWLRDVRTVKKLALPTQSVNQASLTEKYSHLRGIPIKSYSQAKCGILIGINNQRLLLAQKLREGSFDEPVAFKTRLGWCVTGNNENEKNEYGVYHACDCNKDLHEMVRQHYVLEDCGVEKNSMKSSDDMRAIQILNDTVHKEDGKFKSGLLWRLDKIVLPNSYPMALKRHKCLEKMVATDSNLLETVNNQVNNLIAKGYAMKLSATELERQHSRIWYLPAFMVKNRNKPGKVRMVLDGAARTQGTSLNDMLLKGPDELTILTDVLHALRLKRIAISGDIEEMFLQIRIRDEDQDCLRFLWNYGNINTEPEIFKMLVLPFGLRCSPSIAQHVKNKNAKLYEQSYPEAAKVIMKHHYVDDMLYSVDTVEEAIQIAQDVKHVHSKGGFNIRNWVSNSAEVLQALNQSNISTGKSFMEHQELNSTTKVLGLWWNTSEDTFTYSLKLNKGHVDVLNGVRIPTKRELLRVLMSVFDPLGFLAFYLVKLKILLQDVWKLSIGWDEQIPENLQVSWERWRQLLPQVESVKVQRCYSLRGFKDLSVQLHVFVDASEDAMATVAYFRLDDGTHVDCVIVGAKSKVAPVKPISIPRLELQAALIGSRFARSIFRSHDINISQTIMWTDSRNVLSWLKADPKKLKQFVMFRVGEILELTRLEDWRWVPTKMNVADEATKWTKQPNFDEACRWFKGPSFLYEKSGNWPSISNENVDILELRPQYLLHTVSTNEEQVISFDKFSNWTRLLYTIAYCLRYINNLSRKRLNLPKNSGVISSVELYEAEIELFKLAQKDSFTEEIAALRNLKVLPKSSSLYKSSPYLDAKGVLRVEGRIDRAWFITEETKRPVILSKNHPMSFFIVKHYHHRFYHQCQETIVNEVRQRFWIPSLRSLVRSVRLKCPVCIMKSATPSCPKMSPLPEARLAAFVRPFTYTGVDYFGPILVKSGRKTEKRWGVLFTCLTIRAVHIEVAQSLTTDSCIICIRNFISRRGTPREIYSDNGTNFKGAEKELRDSFTKVNKEVLKRQFISAETKWFFNPPAAPHMGGCWEWLVRSVKDVLYQVTRNQRLNDESLMASLIEVESILNSRPLTHVPVNPDDAEALTPNHFLIGSPNGYKPLGNFCDKDLLLRKNWRVCQQIANIFWKRWVKEYMPTLTRRTKWFKDVKNVEENDIVLIVDENLPRGSWMKGVVISTTKAKDGQVRRAIVKTANGVYERPVVKLAVLDICNSKCGEPADESDVSPGGRNVNG